MANPFVRTIVSWIRGGVKQLIERSVGRNADNSFGIDDEKDISSREGGGIEFSVVVMTAEGRDGNGENIHEKNLLSSVIVFGGRYFEPQRNTD
jgi:hypothetical protein